jgi:hypothetical protein
MSRDIVNRMNALFKGSQPTVADLMLAVEMYGLTGPQKKQVVIDVMTNLYPNADLAYLSPLIDTIVTIAHHGLKGSKWCNCF